MLNLTNDDSCRKAPWPDLVWLYVIAVDHPGVHEIKVGISEAPERRRMALEREAQSNLYIAYVVGPMRRAVARRFERMTHGRLVEFWMSGEWFKCSWETAVRAVEGARAQLLGIVI